ncbi:sugar 3,4-ketoisomerase [Sporolactobacillus laevolacticus]|uniref:sugar 3,4-ketoisomerase n=1 Tax=Sporolactobacillus laevolacticus TaxID=33018 RepID=UPI0025B3F28D|nr:FdtA/QdtA family cupin domain-containing protein [Sporolactobacillus laevolacticus]MDN3954877.1 FdtA/QdtA family cupin domain-containing protein [Sporolactobacillus laevolacticus]
MMYNCALLKFKDIVSKDGHLSSIEEQIDVPFEIKRVYYVTGVAQEAERGFHAHKKLHQVLICLNGSIKVRLKSPNKEEIVKLYDPSVGLYIGPLIWHELFDFVKGSVLLVVASEYYFEEDYIRDYNLYLNEAKKLFPTNLVDDSKIS